jgi:CBS domain-containing protein
MQTVAELMVARPVTVGPDESVVTAAQRMRDADIGNVVVTDGERVQGILTDRDIVVRAVAGGGDLSRTRASSLCSSDLCTIRPQESVTRAVELMREHSVRRLPVVADGAVVGVLSLGDLAIERDERSVLADISAATPNQ